jgi:hypothetical protein
MNAVITVATLILAARNDASLHAALVQQPEQVAESRHLQPQVAEAAGFVLKKRPQTKEGIWY